MILRRLASALKRQDWATVTVELILVVAGVLIALHVDNWNEERKARALETQYLERLLADLDGSIADFNVNWNWDRLRLDRQYLVLTSLRAGTLDPADADIFASGLAWAGIHNPQRRRWGTVEELISTGNIALIRDLKLRSDISRLGAWYDRNNEIVQSAIDRVGYLRSALTKRYEILAFDGASPGPAIVRYDFDALKQDQDFISTFADLQHASDQIANFSYGSMTQFATLRDQLAERLGVSHDTLTELPEVTPRPWRQVPTDAEGDAS